MQRAQHQQSEAAIPHNFAKFDANFKAGEAYVHSLPDMQNEKTETEGLKPIPIIQVGINNFKLPLNIMGADCEMRQVQASVTGTVSLAAQSKGINMSRIMRTFYRYSERVFTPDLLEEILAQYKKDLETSRARIKIRFSYPIMQTSLRSGLKGWQYYDCSYEGIIDDLNRFRKIVSFDFIYSSACPCSSELSEHARNTRNIYCIPHSQRSKARITLELEKNSHMPIEDIHAKCLNALKTETQVMVKREDEQAFAEMNGAYVKFVEDAARLLHKEFDCDTRVKDFEITCVHLESLHSHDAVSVVCKGRPGGFTGSFSDFSSLVC